MAAVAALALMPLSCTVQQPESTTYFDTTISPILTAGCVRANTGTGCHVADARGNAFGNLDLSTFDGVNRRRDLLQTYGPYPRPSLIIKNIQPFSITLQTFDGQTLPAFTTDIKHVGGPILDPIQTAASTLVAWMSNGATAYNTGPQSQSLVHYPCVNADPDMTQAPFNASVCSASTMASCFDPSKIDHTTADYKMFVANGGPAFVIQGTCASGNCHGTASNELYFLCGTDQAQVDWNYFTASQYISNPPRTSEILRRPLDPANGGSFHEGGVIFSGPSDPNYVAMLDWATAHGPQAFTNVDPNLLFFAHRVQPMLVKKGCMMLQCHSAAMFHDYRLRGGSGGSFSYAATFKNYQISLEQLGVDSPDFNASRIARKNLVRAELAGNPLATPDTDAGADLETDAEAADAGEGGTPDTGAGVTAEAGEGDAGAAPAGSDSVPVGILHRGGALFADFPENVVGNPTATSCPPTGTATPNLYDTNSIDSIPVYCMFKEWHARERAARNLSPLSAIVYVRRMPQTGDDRAQDFDVFAPNAELHIVPATIQPASVPWTAGANDAPTQVSVNSVVLGTPDKIVDLTLCPGLAAGADVRRPAVSWDGTTIAFAARMTMSDPLAVYEMDAQGTTCLKHALNAVTFPSQCASGTPGILVQNFDPAYAPDGRIVFASTRGNLPLAQGNFSYCGPQVTPADPNKPNSNLYVYDPSSQQTTQLTYLLDMERHPSLMVDGRAIFTTEKREPNFSQLALRRQNLDTGDYHPLYAQRASIGYHQADHVVEMNDKSFAAIFSDQGSLHGGGVLGTFNRSIGVDFTSTNPADYPIDPTVLDPNSLSYPERPSFFLDSLRIPPTLDGSGTPGQVGYLYTTPSPLPGGMLLASKSTAVADPAQFQGLYDLYAIDPETGNATLLVPGGGEQVVEAVAVYPRFVRGPDLPLAFTSALDEPNGHTMVVSGQTNVDATYLDMRILSSLFFQNTPTGRLIDPGLTSVDVYEELPPDPGITSLSPGPYVASDSFGMVWVKRRLLGTIPMSSDASAHAELPGGVPLVFHLPDTKMSVQKMLPRWQREEVQYSPGEVLNQGFSGQVPNAGPIGPGSPPPSNPFFNGLCGQCHGSISGQAVDVAVNPDMLTQASNVLGRTSPATSLAIAPDARGSFVGPPAANAQ
jgi:hypothetical protein